MISAKYWGVGLLLIVCIKSVYTQNCEMLNKQLEGLQNNLDKLYEEIDGELEKSKKQILLNDIYETVDSCDSVLSLLSDCTNSYLQYYKLAASALGAKKFSNINIETYSIKWFEECVLLMKKMEPDTVLFERIANSYKNIAIAYQFSNLEQAELYFEKALGVLQDQAPTKALALIHYAYSEYKQLLGEWSESIRHAQLSYEASIHLNKPSLAAQAKNELGILNNILGNYNEAIEYLQEALAFAKIDGYYVESGQIYHNIGNAYLELSKLDKASYYYQLARKAYETSDYPLFASLFNNIAIIYIRKARQAKQASKTKEINILLIEAKQHLMQAIALNEQSQSNIDLSFNHDNLGDIYEIQEEYDSAQIHYNKAIAYALSNWSSDCNSCITEETLAFMDVPAQNLFTFLGSKAKVSFLQYQQSEDPHLLDISLNIYQQAFEVINIIRNRVQTRNSRLFWTEEGTPIFEGAIKVSLTAKDTVQAFQWSERARAALLYMNMRERELMSQILPENIREREKDLSMRILFNERIYRDTKDSKIAQNLIGLRNERRRLLGNLQKDYPQYFKLKYDPDIIHPDSLRANLPTNSCMLEYFIGSEAMYIFKLDSSALKVYVSPAIDPSVMNKYRSSMQSKDFTNNNRMHLQMLSSDLSQKIIHPLLKNSSLPKRLIIIPHGELGYIPFETLSTQTIDTPTSWKTFPFLIKSHMISYSWSATIWKSNLSSLRLRQARRQALIYAPEFGLGVSKLRALNLNQEEAKSIAEMLNTQPILGIDASLHHFKKEAHSYRMIHLATHGGTNPENPLSNYIAFNTKGISDTTSYLLYMSDLYGMQLTADMVVLSACETGYGNLFKGEGISSMARAFTYAGVRATVMSFWKVDANFTNVNLMTGFYRNLLAGEHKDKALQRIKIELINNDEWPYHWAPFVLQGNTSPLKLGTQSNIGLWKIFIVLLALIVVSVCAFTILKGKQLG